MNEAIGRLRNLPIALRLLMLACLLLSALGCARLLSLPGQPYGVLAAIFACVGFMLASFSLGYLAWRLFSSDPVRSAMGRYHRRLLATMLTYAVVLVGSVILLQRGFGVGLMGYVLAIAPALPIIAIFVVMALFLREETDDFQRKIVADSCLLAAAVTFSEATLWGFLEGNGKVPHVPLYAVSCIFFAQIGPALVFISRAYR